MIDALTGGTEGSAALPPQTAPGLFHFTPESHVSGCGISQHLASTPTYEATRFLRKLHLTMTFGSFDREGKDWKDFYIASPVLWSSSVQ